MAESEYCRCTRDMNSGFSFDQYMNDWVHASCRKPKRKWLDEPVKEVVVVHTNIKFSSAQNWTPTSHLNAFRAALPHRIRPMICKCASEGDKNHWYEYDHDRKLMSCSRCRKSPVADVYKCLECDFVFLKDFNHPAFCILDPFCWDHLCKDLEIPECGHNAKFMDRDHPMNPTTLINKRITAADLEGFDLFEETDF